MRLALLLVATVGAACAAQRPEAQNPQRPGTVEQTLEFMAAEWGRRGLRGHVGEPSQARVRLVQDSPAGMFVAVPVGQKDGRRVGDWMRLSRGAEYVGSCLLQVVHNEFSIGRMDHAYPGAGWPPRVDDRIWGDTFPSRPFTPVWTETVHRNASVSAVIADGGYELDCGYLAGVLQGDACEVVRDAEWVGYVRVRSSGPTSALAVPFWPAKGSVRAGDRVVRSFGFRDGNESPVVHAEVSAAVASAPPPAMTSLRTAVRALGGERYNGASDRVALVEGIYVAVELSPGSNLRIGQRRPVARGGRCLGVLRMLEFDGDRWGFGRMESSGIPRVGDDLVDADSQWRSRGGPAALVRPVEFRETARGKVHQAAGGRRCRFGRASDVRGRAPGGPALDARDLDRRK